MLVEHKFSVSATCPIDGKRDAYTVWIVLDRAIPVEEIVAKAQAIITEPILQEHLTEKLSELFGCRVKTLGMHGSVETTVTCGIGGE